MTKQEAAEIHRKATITLKDRRVLASCRTEEQRKVAAKYHELALKAVRS